MQNASEVYFFIKSMSTMKSETPSGRVKSAKFDRRIGAVQSMVLLAVYLLLLCRSISAAHFKASSHLSIPRSCWGLRSSVPVGQNVFLRIPRGGGKDDDEDEDVDETKGGEDEEDYEDEEEYDEESEEYDEDVDDEDQLEVKDQEYDEPLQVSPMMSMYVTLGIMFLSKKIDLFSPNVVRLARFAFICYIAAIQFFLFYVRVEAKKKNDRTPITLQNPMSSVLQSQLESSPGGGGGMMKNLASSFLQSKSTVLEYDLKQAKSMQSGLIFNMGFMWFFHFKMQQVQPLIQQTVSGIINLVTSPLFQVYVMKRNLERPFKNPGAAKLEVAANQLKESAQKAEHSEATQEEEETGTNDEEDDVDDQKADSDSQNGGDNEDEGEEEIPSDNDAVDDDDVQADEPEDE